MTAAAYIFPTSLSQRQLWFIDQLAPSSAYNVVYCLRLRGPLVVPHLEHAVQQVIDRHEALRTTIIIPESDPVQLVSSSARVSLELIDLQDAHDPEQAMRERVREVCRLRFDLRRGPLLRSHLLQVARQEHVLLLTFHHIIVDAWSVGIIGNELCTAYNAAGGEAPLAPVALQYGDYAEWESAWLASQEFAEARQFWKTRLAGHPGVIELSGDRPRPAVPSQRGGMRWFTIPTALLARLEALARGESATLFMLVLAGFAALLKRRGGQRDLLIGAPFANRDRPELEPVVGYFVNSVVFRIDAGGAPSTRELIVRVREAVFDSMAHRALPFAEVVRAASPERSESHTPLFQVFVQVFPAEQLAAPPRYEGLEVSPVDPDKGSSPYDLNLNLFARRPDGLRGYLEYNADLFEVATVDRMIGHFQCLLEGMANEPDRVLDTLPLLSAAELHELELWNQTARALPGESVHGFFEAQARKTPDAIAARCGEAHLTYRELDARSNQLAHHLRARGVATDATVGICVERSLEMIVGLLGILKAGGAYLPLDPEHPRERLGFMIEDARPVLTLTQARLAQLVTGPVLNLDEDWPVVAEAPTTPVSGPIHGEQLAYIIYTSGSTGRPKGAMNRHRSVGNRLAWMQAEYRLSANDVVLQKTPFSFDVSVWELFWPLMCGASLVFARPGGHREPSYLADLIARWGVTTLHFVPSMLAVFLEEANLEQRCGTVRKVVCSGEALSRDLVDRCHAILAADVHNLYGPTEAAVDVTAHACQRGDTRPTVPIGRPIANTTMHVLDDHFARVPVCVPGELYIGGVQLARGYVARPDLTAERFLPDPWSDEGGARMYRTGDLARWLPDGSIEYLGRTDHQIKLRGLRIELGEIEAALLEQPGVTHAVVLARDDVASERALVGYLVGDAIDLQVLKAGLARRLPEYMVPSRFVLLDAMPLSANGKLDRRALPAPSADRRVDDYVAPRSVVEQALAALWAELLGLDRVGLRDNFFALGGHSLLATRLIARIRDRFAAELTIGELFRVGDLEAAALLVEAASKGPRAPTIARVPRSGHLPLSVQQERMWRDAQSRPDDPVFHTWNAQRIVGRLDPDRLERALRAVVARQETLRSYIRVENGRVGQGIHPADAALRSRVVIQRVDLRALPAAEREAEADRRFALLSQQPFELTTWPVWRVALLQLTDDEHVFIWVAHHLFFDGASYGILFHDLTAYYEERTDPESLPELAFDLADYAVWQHSEGRAQRAAKAVAYWRRRLTGFRAPPRVPSDHPRDDSTAGPGAMRRLSLEGAPLHALRELGRAERCSLFTLLLAVWKVLLMHRTGEQDVVVGVPLSPRDQPGLERLIGYLVNHIPLRTDLSGDPSFRELLQRVHAVTNGAIANQDVCLVSSGVLTAAEHDLQYRVRYNFQIVEPTFALAGLPTTSFPGSGTGMTPFELALYVVDGETFLRMNLRYRADLFLSDTVDRLLSDYCALIARCVEHPELPLSRLGG